MVTRVRNALGRQNDKKKKAETKLQTIEQKILQVLSGLQGGCHNMDCICQVFPERDSSVLSKQIAGVFNGLIISGKIRLSRIKIDHGKATVYFAVTRQKH